MQRNKKQKIHPQKTFDTAVNTLIPAYCSSDRLILITDIVRQCYNDTDASTSENDICVFEDTILKSLADTYRYRSERMGNDDPTAGIKFISPDSIATRYDNKMVYFHRQDLTFKQQFHYFMDRVHESFDVLNAKCKQLRH